MYHMFIGRHFTHSINRQSTTIWNLTQCGMYTSSLKNRTPAVIFWHSDVKTALMTIILVYVV